MCVQRVGSHPFLRLVRLLVCLAERELMEGNAKIIKLIARDEALHLTSTQHMLNFDAFGCR